jgi:hypothetical protein
MHELPREPHALAPGVVHIEPEQHPFWQVTLQPAHAPALHTVVDGQELQLLPPVPHAACWLPGSHVAPLQHPAHVVLSQTHAPPEQRCPVEHAGPPPHVHVPPEEQPSPAEPHAWHADPPVPQEGPVGGEVQTFFVQHPLGHDAELHTQAPPVQTCPELQGGPAPQAHAPEGEQLSA